jgi:ferredoxin
MREVEAAGATLNQNYGINHVENGSGMVLKEYQYTAFLDEADAIIDFCKLKTHGMMGMSAAAKNMFGCIPGVSKPEYHFRFPKHEDFARMIVDLDEYFKPRLCICDAVVGMEGNGPTMGTPRKIGAVLASTCPHKMDMVCAELIGLTRDDVPTLAAAYERGLVPDRIEDLAIHGDPKAFSLSDFQNIPNRSSVEFNKESTKFFGKLSALFIGKALRSVPSLKKNECVGCGVCRDICPAKAIEIKKGKAVIDRSVCIRCFCCQEFCPKGAMKVKRPLLAKLLNK